MKVGFIENYIKITYFVASTPKAKLVRKRKNKVQEFKVMGENNGNKVLDRNKFMNWEACCYASQYLLIEGENNYTVILIMDSHVENT